MRLHIRTLRIFVMAAAVLHVPSLPSISVAQGKQGSRLVAIEAPTAYPDGRPSARYRLDARDAGIVYRHGQGPNECDKLGARDIWVWEHRGTYYMHYDGAGTKGWLACLATSKNATTWKPQGPELEFGEPGQKDAASASYGMTFLDKNRWHMFYLGTPHTSPPPDLVPAFPYLTMKAEGASPTGPWTKHYDVEPFSPQPETYYSATASPGFIVPRSGAWRMFFSASTDKPILRTIGIARTRNLDGPWRIDAQPIVPPAEQVENTSLYFEPTNKTWFLFTNHVGLKNGLEYTDAIWVYWTKDLERWNENNKAIVLDGSNCSWSKEIIGLPSVVKVGKQLAVFYDGHAGQGIPDGAASHMQRDIGLAWLSLPLDVGMK
jgi:predicted GH43/DUF377 family glycosyl hydrolase